MGKKNKFIDKKRSATFQLLARDSSDPNYNETPGGDRVFVRVDNNNQYSVDTFFHEDNPDGEDPNSIFANAPDDFDDDDDHNVRFLGSSMKFGGGASSADAAPLPEHVRKEILELGFPDDGYNYLLHLREIKNTGGGSYYYRNPKASFDQLPHDVKAYDASRVRVSEVKRDDTNDKSIYSVASKTVGVKVQKVFDPEVAALLDDSDLSRFGSDVEDLEEDFVVRANVPEDDNDNKLNLIDQANEHVPGNQEAAVDNVIVEKEEKEEVGNDLPGEKQRVRRLLDEQFDLLECQEYGTDDEDDDYDGYYAEEDESLANRLNLVLINRAMDDTELSDKYEVPPMDVIHRCVEYAQKYENEDGDADLVVVEESSDESEQWDCETIVSTYSNLDNHPAKIEAPGTARKKKLAETVSGALNAKAHVITLRGKEKLPVDFLPRGRKSDAEKMKSVPELKAEPLKRKQHGQESKEEKKERKAAMKKERSEARRMKKEVKELYRGEAQRAQRVAAIAGPSSIRLL
ncbi:protein LTV1 homolog isoform X2 [Ricinus communis]|uniref:Protein LTV1 homolog n=1 Tax=Ricinus communis TaxID=3988 RepID=B9R836_RICCO|nr:protein LTV1 homolog isoform X1 [Ricinus communis]XP_015576580.1 protein LTV1 homolog isoform X2 [Ricinus communis]EEF52666.1 conserved hypothetical protein [Ricinus communis]|eukprot:XP_002510479.1 protein LTV1 homolog isoform X2 [Ricinus communis]